MLTKNIAASIVGQTRKYMALSYFACIAEERIREAQREGAFDNLPGKGKPLVLFDSLILRFPVSCFPEPKADC